MKGKIQQFLFDNLDIQTDLFFNFPNVQIVGNHMLSIEGCIGIKKYETDEIILRCKNYNVSIIGKDLTMLTFTQGKINVRGEIKRYEIERV